MQNNKKILHGIDVHMRELIRGASTAFVLQVFAAGLAFLFYVVLARLLGADGAGLYFLSFTIITIVATAGRLGLDNTIVRFIAGNIAINDWSAVKGVHSKAVQSVILSSFLLSVSVFVLAPWLSESVFSKPDLLNPLRLLSLSILPLALFTLYANALRALKRIRDAILALSVLAPLIALIGSALLAPLWHVNGASLAYLLGATGALAFSIWRWKILTPELKNIKGKISIKEILDSSVPLFWVSLAQMIINWSPILILGAWVSSKEVGIFSAANKTAMLTSFVLVAVNSIAAPKFAALYKQKDIDSLELVVRKTTKIMSLLASPILIIFLLVPEKIMSIFGSQFSEGSTALIILVIGQYINVITGSVGVLLMMTGHERLVRNNIAISASISLIFSFFLVPKFGILGAAIAMALALSTQNILHSIFVWKELKIIILPFPKNFLKVSK